MKKAILCGLGWTLAVAVTFLTLNLMLLGPIPGFHLASRLELSWTQTAILGAISASGLALIFDLGSSLKEQQRCLVDKDGARLSRRPVVWCPEMARDPRI